MAYFLIEDGVKPREQTAGTVIPRPPHVVGEFLQLVQGFWDVTLHGNRFPLSLIGVACFNLHKYCFWKSVLQKNDLFCGLLCHSGLRTAQRDVVGFVVIADKVLPLSLLGEGCSGLASHLDLLF